MEPYTFISAEIPSIVSLPGEETLARSLALLTVLPLGEEEASRKDFSARSPWLRLF